MPKIASIIIFFFISVICTAQERQLNNKITLHATHATISQVIHELENQYQISFYYSSSKLPLNYRVTINADSLELGLLLNDLCNQAGIKYKISNNQVILYSPNQNSRQTVTISGFVSDSLTGERLIGATIFLPDKKTGASTNEYGFFSLSLEPGIYKISCSYVGYAIAETTIDAKISRQITFAMHTRASEIKPVLLESGLNKTMNLNPGTDILPVSLMENYPALLGEKDVVQFLKLMPGVQTTTEGLNGLYVRGCLPQHTSFLIDDAPMFNMFHFSGWFSTLNPDAIKEVRLHKSILPAKTGGSLASVAEISLRDGNNQHYDLTGGAGTITSRLTFEGPIIRGRSSFIISFRRSYLDAIIRLFNLENLIDIGNLYFYDLNAKINFTLNTRNRFYFSTYKGLDLLDDRNGISWGNSLFSARWNHLFSDKIFGNLTVTGSGYDHAFKGTADDNDNYKINVAIRNYNIKYDLSVYPSVNRKMNIGFNSRYILFPPIGISGNTLSLNAESEDKKTYKLVLTTFYCQGDFRISPKFNTNIGIRFVLADKIYPDNVRTRLDPEPILTFQYAVSDVSSFKLGYARNHQYYHGLSVFDLIIPFDKYILWGNRLKPQIADHVTAGFYYIPVSKKIEFSAEPYFSWLRNQDRIPVTEEIFIERDVDIFPLTGRLNIAGIDFSVRKTSGCFTGFISYSLMKTYKKEDGINHNTYFQTYYDRRHDLVLNANYQLSRRIGFSSTWVFMSGNPYSLPVGKYELRGRSIPLYDENNLYNRRMPNYHRLDISARIGLGKQTPCRHSITLMVYNVYAHRNAVFYHYSDVVGGDPERDPNSGSDRLFSMMGYYFFNIFPAFSYEFKFGK